MVDEFEDLELNHLFPHASCQNYALSWGKVCFIKEYYNIILQNFKPEKNFNVKVMSMNQRAPQSKKY